MWIQPGLRRGRRNVGRLAAHALSRRPALEEIVGPGNALHVYNDGSGDALWLGGTLYIVDDALFSGVVRYDGSTFDTLSAGQPGSLSISVHDLTV